MNALTNNVVGLDFETYGAVDLMVHGLDRYITDDTFRVLIGAVFEPKPSGAGVVVGLDFVGENFDQVKNRLAGLIAGKYVVAHNVMFEYRVLKWLGLEDLPTGYIDSAVCARAAGAHGSLASASKQLLKEEKLTSGVNLIKVFSVPGVYQEHDESPYFNKQVVTDNPVDWDDFMHYCKVDAMLSWQLLDRYPLTVKEQLYSEITFEMNLRGWPVDRDIVEEMYARYLENQSQALSDFAVRHGQLNVNSLKQLKEFCEKRGIKASSFDEKHVAHLKDRIIKKLAAGGVPPDKHDAYVEVLDLLDLKQILGGSSLKKLKVLLDTIVNDGTGWRLRDQYLHVGAGQTYRTTGRSVQMQNLKQMRAVMDMNDLTDPDFEADNNSLAENIRQVFTSSHPQGALIVGDFSSIESRGLAYQAGEDWKLEAYRKGLGVYEMLAAEMYGIRYEDVAKDSPERRAGKVGELSCGYCAGAGAVQSFAAGMDIQLNEAEAQKIVNDWRSANPKTVDYWGVLDGMLHAVMGGAPVQQHTLPHGETLEFKLISAPRSLTDMMPSARTLVIILRTASGMPYMQRRFHGVYATGRNVRYWKPSKKKTGEPWVNNYRDPKTGQVRFFELYGGKLAGIITQSFCRELFFEQLQMVHKWTNGTSGVDLIGQFHDEIVLDWVPGYSVQLVQAKAKLDALMSSNQSFLHFPMAAEIKSDYRYTK